MEILVYYGFKKKYFAEKKERKKERTNERTKKHSWISWTSGARTRRLSLSMHLYFRMPFHRQFDKKYVFRAYVFIDRILLIPRGTTAQWISFNIQNDLKLNWLMGSLPWLLSHFKSILVKFAVKLFFLFLKITINQIINNTIFSATLNRMLHFSLLLHMMLMVFTIYELKINSVSNEINFNRIITCFRMAHSTNWACGDSMEYGFGVLVVNNDENSRKNNCKLMNWCSSSLCCVQYSIKQHKEMNIFFLKIDKKN